MNRAQFLSLFAIPFLPKVDLSENDKCPFNVELIKKRLDFLKKYPLTEKEAFPCKNDKPIKEIAPNFRYETLVLHQEEIRDRSFDWDSGSCACGFIIRDHEMFPFIKIALLQPNEYFKIGSQSMLNRFRPMDIVIDMNLKKYSILKVNTEKPYNHYIEIIEI